MRSRPSRVRIAVVLALVGAMVSVMALPVGAQSTEERRLQETRQQIARVRAEMDGARAQRNQDAAALAEADGRLNEVLEAVHAAEQAVQRQRQAVDDAREELADLRDQATRHQNAMQERAVALYKRGGGGASVGAVLSSGSADEALRRVGYVDIVNNADRRDLEGVSAAGTSIDAQRKVLEEEEKVLARVLDQQRALHAEVETLRDERAVVFASSDERVNELEAQEEHLESESRELAAMARREQRRRADRAARAQQEAQQAAAQQSEPAVGGGGGGELAGGAHTDAASTPSSGGGWTWPASGPVTSGYGPRWGRMHEGIDIGASTGSPIRAARSGTVTFTGSRGGYGQTTMIDHGGGIVTVYAHQSGINVSSGQSVSAGQPIGSVGCTGSCTGPHLHFEVRVSGAARNPRGYLP